MSWYTARRNDNLAARRILALEDSATATQTECGLKCCWHLATVGRSTARSSLLRNERRTFGKEQQTTRATTFYISGTLVATPDRTRVHFTRFGEIVAERFLACIDSPTPTDMTAIFFGSWRAYKECITMWKRLTEQQQQQHHQRGWE